MDLDTFRALFNRLQAGDEIAAQEFLDEFAPALRRHVRVLLAGSGIEAAHSTSDVLQSLYLNFHVRLRAGEYDFESPAQVHAMLEKMARHKVLDKIRHERADIRDRRRLKHGGDEALLGLADEEATPSHIVSARELLADVLRRLPADVRHIALRRGEGCSWPELARELNEQADALRIRLQRALNKILDQFGPEAFRP